MREIKFRQPQIDSKGKFLYWHYWGYVLEDNLEHFVGPLPVGVSGNSMQHTGLKDKNGIEIYGSIPINGEMSKGGDIVTYYDGRIQYSKEYPDGKKLFPYFEVKWDECGRWNFGECFTGKFPEMEVIGNAAENPELLEEAEK